MSLQELQRYLIPGLLIAFIGWRFFKFRKIKSMIPDLIKRGAIVVDVRSPGEFSMGARPGSVNIPLAEINSRAKELDTSKTIILCCASGARSGAALGILKKNGFKKVLNAGPWTNTLAVFLLILLSSVTQAQTLSFKSVWEQIRKNSAILESSQLQEDSFFEAKQRNSHHWLPRIYLDAKSYQTNDPGSSFFGLLEQRSLLQSDLNPAGINHPEVHLYTRGALGIDWALYEGGSKSTLLKVTDLELSAQKSINAQNQLEQYSQASLAYGTIQIIEQQKSKLLTLNSEISRMIKGYQLGNKSNPVGYSGLLGMKSLQNRIESLVNQFEAQAQSSFESLTALGLQSSGWIPESGDPIEFVRLYLSPQSLTESSYKIEGIEENAKLSSEMSNMEKAKFRPRIGAFAESYVFNGQRTTDNGYNAGVYLQWSLFDPSSFGLLKESQLKAQSAIKYLQALTQQEVAERSALYDSRQAFQKNRTLLEDSFKILIEQSKMTETLFRNGSINALQIVEVLSRRADLIAMQTEVHLGLLKVSSQLVTKQKYHLEQVIPREVRHEEQ